MTTTFFADRDIYDAVSFILGVIGFAIAVTPFFLRWRKRALDEHDALFEMSRSFESYRISREKDLLAIKRELIVLQERLKKVDPDSFVDQAKELFRVGRWEDLERQSLDYLNCLFEAISVACENVVEQRILSSDRNGAAVLEDAERFANLGLAATPNSKRLIELQRLIRLRKESIARGEPLEALNWEGMSDVQLNYLSKILSRDGHLQLAEIAAKRSVPLALLRTGPKSRNLSGALEQHANTLMLISDYVSAENALRCAVEIDRDIQLLDQSDHANRLHNLAVSIDQQGRHSEAEALYLSALAIYQKTLGKDHSYVQTTAMTLRDLIRNHLPSSPHLAEVEAALSAAPLRNQSS